MYYSEAFVPTSRSSSSCPLEPPLPLTVVSSTIRRSPAFIFPPATPTLRRQLARKPPVPRQVDAHLAHLIRRHLNALDAEGVCLVLGAAGVVGPLLGQRRPWRQLRIDQPGLSSHPPGMVASDSPRRYRPLGIDDPLPRHRVAVELGLRVRREVLEADAHLPRSVR